MMRITRANATTPKGLNTLARPSAFASRPLQNLMRPAHTVSRASSEEGPASSSGSLSPSVMGKIPEVEQQGYTVHSWLWQGKYKTRYATAGCGAPVVLVHGFGASMGHYRKTIRTLAAAGYKVYCPDLIGFGSSEKPKDFPYSIEQWRDQIVDFVDEFVSDAAPVVLVGNSIGSLITLAAAAKMGHERTKGTVLINSAFAMNNKGAFASAPGSEKTIAQQISGAIFQAIFALIDGLLLTPPIARRLFDAYRGPENIRGVLKAVYKNEEAITDELVDIFYRPSCDDGALEAFVRIITGPPGPSPRDLLPSVAGPMLILWGDQDPFTPGNAAGGIYFQQLKDTRAGTTFEWIEGAGHAPHDDRPERVDAVLLPWLERLHGGNGNCAA